MENFYIKDLLIAYLAIAAVVFAHNVIGFAELMRKDWRWVVIREMYLLEGMINLLYAVFLILYDAALWPIPMNWKFFWHKQI